MGAPVTAERIERAMDRLAEVIVSLGGAGSRVLPIYQRLEEELATLRRADSSMDSVLDRLRRSKGRKAAQRPS